jgi:hypothetical protein
MTRPQIREIFRNANEFYCFEDTALALEAQLCGCPVVFTPSEILRPPLLTSIELGTGGYGFAGTPAALAQASATSGNLRGIIATHIAQTPGRIASLAQTYQALASAGTYRGTITYPFAPRLVLVSPPQENSQST